MRICKREVIVLRRSILAIGIVVLFIEAAFTPSINANKDFLNPDAGNICLNDSDLVCWGELNWTNVKPSETVYGRFTIRNAGKIDTLYWEISDSICKYDCTKSRKQNFYWTC